MPHYSINDIYSQFNVNATSSLKSTPERELPIFIDKTDINDSYDQLIVGGGISGLYAAYKILKEKKRSNEKWSILIIEQSKRTGGRLDTDLFLIDKNLLKEEEGGMRFTFEDMPQLMNLFVELGLDKDIVPFPMHLDDNNRLLFRGKTFNRRESKRNNYKIWSDLYGLKNGEKGINPSEIIPQYIYDKIIKSEHEDQRFKDENKAAKEVLDRLNVEHKKYVRGEEYDKFIKLNHEEIKAIYGDDAGITEKRIEVSAAGIWQFFRLAFKWKGIELYKWTLWALLADMGYSNECIQMMARVGGFNGTYFSTMNAGEAFQLLMEFPAEPDFKSLRYGFSQLTNALIDKLSELRTDSTKVDIVLTTRVLEIKNDNSSITLLINTYLEKTSQYKEIKCTSTILALPRVAIEKLINASSFPIESERKLWNTLESTSNQPLAKINLYYDKAWWNSGNTPNASVTFGPNFTDLPLGSVYPFYSDDEELTKTSAKLQFLKVEISHLNDAIKELKKRVEETKDQDSKEKLEELKEKLATKTNCLRDLEADFNDKMKVVYPKPAALTVYCDYQNINFWQGFAKTLTKENAYPQSDHVMQITELNKEEPLESKTTLIEPQYITPASEYMVTAITEYFQQLFQTNNIPKPIATSVRIWEGSQSLKTDAYGNFGYGVHQWGVGTKDDDVINNMIKPFGDLPIYTCGEAYSDFQGWVEGALRSTNLVLKEVAGIENDVDNAKILEIMRDKYNNRYSL